MQKAVLLTLMGMALSAHSGMPDWRDYPSNYEPPGLTFLMVIVVAGVILRALRK